MTREERINGMSSSGFDNSTAAREGWVICEMSPPFHEDEPYQLEAVANPEIGAILFDDDEQAVDFVIERARAGSIYHLTALQFLSTNSPRELSNFPAIRRIIDELKGK